MSSRNLLPLSLLTFRLFLIHNCYTGTKLYKILSVLVRAQCPTYLYGELSSIAKSDLTAMSSCLQCGLCWPPRTLSLSLPVGGRDCAVLYSALWSPHGQHHTITQTPCLVRRQREAVQYKGISESWETIACQSGEQQYSCNQL